jgi:hypothetical protein
MPNQMMMSGIIAMRGVAYRALRNGQHQPDAAIPSDDDAENDRKSRATPGRLRNSAAEGHVGEEVPSVRRYLNCFAIADGPLKKSGKPSFSRRTPKRKHNDDGASAENQAFVLSV